MKYPFVSELAGVIKDTSEESSNKAVRFPVLGMLDASMNLLPDGFGRPIPAGDYEIYEPIINMYQKPSDEYETFVMDYRLELNLEPGDRVLCVPIEDGHTFIVMGQVG